jgi:hypothetical protein
MHSTQLPLSTFQELKKKLSTFFLICQKIVIFLIESGMGKKKKSSAGDDANRAKRSSIAAQKADSSRCVRLWQMWNFIDAQLNYLDCQSLLRLRCCARFCSSFYRSFCCRALVVGVCSPAQYRSLCGPSPPVLHLALGHSFPFCKHLSSENFSHFWHINEVPLPLYHLTKTWCTAQCGVVRPRARRVLLYKMGWKFVRNHVKLNFVESVVAQECRDQIPGRHVLCLGAKTKNLTIRGTIFQIPHCIYMDVDTILESFTFVEIRRGFDYRIEHSRLEEVLSMLRFQKLELHLLTRLGSLLLTPHPETTELDISPTPKYSMYTAFTVFPNMKRALPNLRKIRMHAADHPGIFAAKCIWPMAEVVSVARLPDCTARDADIALCGMEKDEKACTWCDK